MVRRTVAKDGPHPIDVLVGRRARERRALEGMSQAEVADKLGLAFQQLHKYEKGLNRISASRLYELAQLCETRAVAHLTRTGANRFGQARPATCAIIPEPQAC